MEMSMFPNANRPWREIAVEAQQRRTESIAAVDPPAVPAQLPLNVTAIPGQVLDARENEICTSTTEVLAARVAKGEWTSVEVTEAFLRRAAVAQALTNCITDLLPGRARQRAKELDEFLRMNGRPVGPLHGVPISVKEHVGMKGLDLTSGFCGLYGFIADDDALMLKILWAAGAVFYARTTEPQLLMHLETDNNLYGPTVNPYNTKLTPGGSTGGEGALLGLRGSVLGIGSDIGGSIRSPAGNCGVFGFRPTSGRLPGMGLSSPESYEGILGVVGPLSTSIEGVKLFCKTLIDARPWLVEPTLGAAPWDMSVTLPEKLRVAVLWDDGVVRPHPPVARALRETVQKLRAAPDVEVVDWTPYRHDEGWEIIVPFYFPDAAPRECGIMAGTGEPWLPLSDFILRRNPLVKRLDIAEINRLTMRRDEFRAEHAAHWNATATRFDACGMPLDAVDVILCPVGPGAAPPLNCARYWPYTSHWNLVDYPALVFPVTSVSQELDGRDEGYVPRNEQDKYNHDLYDPARYVDAPVGLQLVGRRHEDEKVIKVYERLAPYL